MSTSSVQNQTDSEEMDFALGDGSESEENEFSLGDDSTSSDDDSEYALDGESSEPQTSSIHTKQNEENITYDLPLDIDDFYSIFIQGHENSRNDYKSIITKKIESYKAVGLRPFEDPTDTDKEKISNLEGKYISAAETKWGRTKGEQIPAFQSAVADLVHFFTCGEKEYKLKFRNVLWEIQMEQLKAAVQSKVDDKVLDSSELVSLVNQATEYGLCNTEEDKKNVIKFIREEALAFGAKLNTYEDDFLDFVRTLDATKRMDIPECWTPLFNQYQALYEESLILGENKPDEDDEVLRRQMRELLEKNGLGLVDNIELFKKEKFDVFVKDYGINLNDPLSSAHYYGLRETARGIYKITDSQWKEFIADKGLIPPNEKKQEFNLGIDENGDLLKTNEIKEIPLLFDKAPDRAKNSLYDGNIEVYLHAVNREDLRAKILEIRTRDYANDKNAGLLKAKYILDDEMPCVLEDGKQFSDRKEIAEALEKNFSYFEKKIGEEKNPSVKLWLEARNYDSNAEDVRNVLNSSETNEYKLNSIILSLQENNYLLDEKEYKNPGEIIKDKDVAEKIVKELLNKNSKLFCWISKNFTDLVENVDKWISLKRHNVRTYTYALESKAPFYYDGKKLKEYKDLENHFSKNAEDKDFMNAFFEEENLEEVNFWAVNYQNESLRKLLVSFLEKNKNEKKAQEPFVKVMDYLSEKTISEKRTEDYFYEILPVLKLANTNQVVTDSYYVGKKNDFFNYLTLNKGPQTDQIVQNFLEKEIKNQNVDKEIIYRLIKYFFREDVDHHFYESNIHPIIDSAISAGFISEDIRKEENTYFVMKYEQALPSMKAKARAETFESIEKLDPLNCHVIAYHQAIIAAQEAVKYEKVCRVFCNFKNCGLIFMHLGIIGVLTLSIMSLWLYIGFGSPRLCWILAVLFMFLTVSSTFKKAEKKKAKKVPLCKFNSKDKNAAMDHVVLEINNGFHTPYKRKNSFGFGQIIGALFVWAVTGVLGYIMYRLSIFNFFTYYFDGLIGLLGFIFLIGFLRKKV